MKTFNLYVCGNYAGKIVQTFCDGFDTEEAAHKAAKKMHAACSWVITQSDVIASNNYPPPEIKPKNIGPIKKR